MRSMDCVNVNILVMISYLSLARCSHWGKWSLGMGAVRQRGGQAGREKAE